MYKKVNKVDLIQQVVYILFWKLYQIKMNNLFLTISIAIDRYTDVPNTTTRFCLFSGFMCFLVD